MNRAKDETAKPRIVDVETMRNAVRFCRRKGLNSAELTRFLTTHCIVDLDLLSEVLAETSAGTTSAAA